MKSTHLSNATSPRAGLLSLICVFITLFSCAYLNAQVFTANIVGYVNVPLTANRYHLVSNPLSASTNTLNGAVANQANGSRAWIWNVTNQVFEGPSVYDAALNVWSINYPIPVGKGFMIHTPTSGTITFVGEVLTGSRTNSVAGTNKLSLLGSIVPQSGGLSCHRSDQNQPGRVESKPASLR